MHLKHVNRTIALFFGVRNILDFFKETRFRTLHYKMLRRKNLWAFTPIKHSNMDLNQTLDQTLELINRTCVPKFLYLESPL